MAEIKKIDFRNLDTQGSSQPSGSYEEEKSRWGSSFDISFAFWERMTKRAKMEIVALVIILLLTAGFLIYYFLR